MEIIEEIKFNVIQGRINEDDEGYDDGLEGKPAVMELVEQALNEGVDVKKIINDGLTAGMNVVGGHFEQGEYLIPDMLASAEAVGAAMKHLEPHFERSGVQSKGKFLIATVKGDLHDIGKNIVAIMLRGAGYDVIDLGVDVPREKILGAVKEHGPRFLGLSALLTTTMREMADIIEGMKADGTRDKVKVLIGGAPTSEDFAEKIGADSHCLDAFAAVDYTKSVN